MFNLMKNIYIYKDAVNVHVIKNEDSALLIDFGSGKVLNILSDLHIKKVDYILHTHYHRDQCYGDNLAREKGIKIGVPAKERKLFSEASNFWETKSYYDLYYFKPTFFVSTQNIPVYLAFKDKDVFEWNSLKFEILKTPGHTTGSISYLLEINGKKLAFTGDLIHSGAKVITYYDLEYIYNDNGEEGIKYSLKSFKRLLSHEPDILLPSHGNPIFNPEKEIQSLEKKFRKARYLFCSEFSGIHVELPQLNERAIPSIDLEKVFPRLYHKAEFPPILIKGKNDNCILLDFAGDKSSGYELNEFKKILQDLQVKYIDFILPTHYHDDHTAGIKMLLKEFNTKIYALENMVDVLENPTHYRLGCLTDQPIKVDRVLKDGEKFTWEDLEFQIFHFPGQTEYHMGLFTTIDSKRLFFTGDSITQRSFVDRDTNLNCLNFCRLGPNVGYMKCADILLKCNPEYLAISHYGIIKVNKNLLKRFKKFVAAYEPIIAELVAQENPNFGFDPNWICFKPIRIIIKNGQFFSTNLIVRNYSNHEATLEFQLNIPPSWKAFPSTAHYSIPPNEFKTFPIQFKLPRNASSKGRHVITANIWWNDENLGPFPDLMVDVDYEPKSAWKAWHPENEIDLALWIYNQMKSSKRYFR